MDVPPIGGRTSLWSAERRAGTDAAILAKATLIPSIVWALLWSLVAVALLGLALWVSVEALMAGLAFGAALAVIAVEPPVQIYLPVG